MFGAERADLPSIWKELVDAGFESGHAYGMSVYHGVHQSCLHMLPEGKALRTVKSCVGSSWCRYGIGDSVGREYSLIDATRLRVTMRSSIHEQWLSSLNNVTRAYGRRISSRGA